jgi:Triose-phosphate Transporter family
MTNSALLWCLLFAVSSPLMVLVNNHIFNRLLFPYPIATAALSIWTTAISSHLLVKTGAWKLERENVSLEYYQRLLVPIALLSACSIGLGNHALMLLSVSFAQMLKAMAPVYILCLLTLYNQRTPSGKAISAVLVICAGTAVASFGEVKFSTAGVTFQVLADLLEAIKIVLIQVALSDERFAVFDLLYYTTPITGLFQLGFIVASEREVLREASLAVVALHWPYFLASAGLGVALSLVGPQVIKATSALTLKLIGIVRNNLLVLSAIHFLGETTSGTQLAGYLVSAVGFVWYTLMEAWKKDRLWVSNEDYGSIKKSLI